MGVIEDLNEKISDLTRVVERLCARVGHDVVELDAWERHPRFTHKCACCEAMFLPADVTARTTLAVKPDA
jgi:hypothetical protein